MNNKKTLEEPVVASMTVSQQIIELLKETQDLAQNTAERVENKLTPVMSRKFDTEAEKNIGKIMDEYSPLFNDIRHLTYCIRESLNAINDSIDRTEI